MVAICIPDYITGPPPLTFKFKAEDLGTLFIPVNPSCGCRLSGETCDNSQRSLHDYLLIRRRAKVSHAK